MKQFSVAALIVVIICSGYVINPGKKNKEKARLGEMLFGEKLLSKDSSVSCSSCHIPSRAFADTVAFSIGIGGKLTNRNTPSVLNMKNRPYYFWDGRIPSLQKQSLIPIENPDEMGLPVEEAVTRLKQSQTYLKLFRKVFNEDPTPANLGEAFAAFEETLETVDSRFDEWSNGKKELSAQEENGRQLFIGKAKCFNCHSMEDFTDDNFKNIGLYDGKDLNDKGRSLVSGKEEDVGKFKTPGLRNVGVTAPYMHNGMFKTLEQVLAYYNMPKHFVDEPQNIDNDLKDGLKLTVEEKKDIIAFLHTLTDKQFRNQ